VSTILVNKQTLYVLTTLMKTWLKPAQRLEKLPPYVFARLDELKLRAKEQGLDLIDLGMGNPDGPTPEPVRSMK